MCCMSNRVRMGKQQREREETEAHTRLNQNKSVLFINKSVRFLFFFIRLYLYEISRERSANDSIDETTIIQHNLYIHCM